MGAATSRPAADLPAADLSVADLSVADLHIATADDPPFDLDRDLAPDGTPLAARLADAPRWLPTVSQGEADDRLPAMIARLAALCDRRGVPAFAPPGRESRIVPSLRRLASGSIPDAASPVRRLLDSLPPNRVRGLSFPPWSPDAAPGFLSDPAAVALLRTGWRRTADALALTWPDRLVSERAADETATQIELRAKGRRLLSGAWGVTVAVGGEHLDLSADWSCVCHHADETGGFLELQWSGESVAGPVRVERQAFLARESGFAALSDAVRLTGLDRDESVPIEHVMTLPIAAGVSGGVAPETREARLFGGKKNWQRARIFPLAVPQRPGGLGDGVSGSSAATIAGETLTVRHAAHGGLVSPVVFDWNRWREEDLAEWRTLTVTEDRRRLTSAHAGAHRLRIGRDQHLFIYRRTDGSPAPRAALGHHFDKETLIAKFSRKGEVTPLLSV